MKPVALLIPEETVYGLVYHPANKNAVNLAGVAGTRTIPEDRLPYIRALGFEVLTQNGQSIPIPHPGSKVSVEA
jgi:hypothetical protein